MLPDIYNFISLNKIEWLRKFSVYFQPPQICGGTNSKGGIISSKGGDYFVFSYTEEYTASFALPLLARLRLLTTQLTNRTDKNVCSNKI